jgi:RNA polymerase sigma-70 factor (ECF subfamily)
MPPITIGSRVRADAAALEGMSGDGTFDREFRRLFDEHQPRLLRFLDRLTGEPELAADLAQEAFLRLYRRGAPPDSPGAWLVSVAMNLFRNAQSKRSRRAQLLTRAPAESLLADAPGARPAAGMEPERIRVRTALDTLPGRERQMLLLHAEGYRYAEIATALELKETSVGTLLARARRAFRQAWEETSHAPG